jgi:hypothetical protein
MRVIRLATGLAGLVALVVACATRGPLETPEQIEARRRVAVLDAMLGDIRLTFDAEDVRGCRSLGVISQDFYATAYKDYFSGDIRQGVEFTAEFALRYAALKAGADTALMPLPVPSWSTAAQNFIFGISKGSPPIECRIVGEIYACEQPTVGGAN